MVPNLVRVVIFAALLVPLRAQTTWHVAAGATPPGSGTVAAPFPSIQTAIDAAASADVVLVSPGIYPERLDFLGKAIEVRSIAGAASTIVDAQQLGRVVTLTSGEGPGTILRGLTLRNGSAPPPSPSTPSNEWGGGGIACFHASVTVIECIVEQCRAYAGQGGYYGGGLRAYDATVVVHATTFRGNGATYGGGLSAIQCPEVLVQSCLFEANGTQGGGGAIHGSGILRVVDSSFRGNSAGFENGGAIDGASEVRRCLFEQNTAYGAGGALANVAYVEASRIRSNASANYGGGAAQCGTMVACEFTDNRAGYGGAISGTTTLRSCILAFNFATSGGSVARDEPTLVHCTLFGNHCAFDPGWFAGGGPAVAVNCIIREPFTSWVPATSFTATYSDVLGGWPGVGNTDLDPVFVAPAAGDFRLQPSSPCRNAGSGSASGLPPVDFEGNPRVIETAPDMGADEFVEPLLGTADDFLLATSIDGSWIEVGTKPAPVASMLDIGIYSPGSTLSGGVLYLGVNLFPNGAAPGSLGVPTSFHLDPATLLLVIDGPTMLPNGLPAAGWTAFGPIPLGFSGLTLRAQAALLHPAARNGSFALSDAHDLVVP